MFGSRLRRATTKDTVDTKVRNWFCLCVLCVLCVESSPRAQIALGIEARRDRFTYHFDGPSSADTPFVVPHFFEQRYVADNIWLVGAARYAAGVRWETSAAITPQRTSTGDDYDTFFNPDAVVVSGTAGGISIRSIRVGQRAELGRIGPLTLSAGYRWRRDRSNFHLGHQTVRRNGVLVSAVDVTTRETTSSQVHELSAGAAFTRAIGSRWQLAIDGELAPTAVGRLAVQLPDKYPGQTLVFLAKAAAAHARVGISRAAGPWAVDLSIEGGRTWSYRRDAKLSRRALGLGVAVTRR